MKKPVNVELLIFDKHYPKCTYDWEMTNARIYVCSSHDNGYTTKASAKRAAKKVAEQLGITITSTEDQI